MPKMMKLKEAAAATGLTYHCLRRWILSGEFTGFVRAGSRYYINMGLLEEFLNSPAPMVKK